MLLRPGRRRTATQDLDGPVHLAATTEDDLGTDLWRAQGRLRCLQPDETTPPEES